MSTGRCRSCGAPVRWARTPNGKPIPIDPEPAANGNILLRQGDLALVLTAAAPGLRHANEPRYAPHFATCPEADQWRNR